MKHIQSLLQIKNGVAVISAEDLAILLGRKHLSVLRAIDAIPSEFLSKDMFLMAGTEVFLTQAGICMLEMARRHLRMRRRIMRALSTFDVEYRKARWVEFHNAKPPKVIIKLFAWLDNVGLKQLALMLFKLICWFQNYDPSKTVNVPKSAK